VDAHSFTAGADYRMYAATMTGFRGGSADTLRDVFASDGTTVLEADDDGGAIESPWNLARTVLPTTGSYYVRVRQFNTASLPGIIFPYDFYLRVLSGSPIPETETNDEGAPTSAALQRLRGRVNGSATAKPDSFAITVNGRDTIGVIVAIDLERGAPVWNVIAGTGVFTGSFIITL
jgi:hypothetical protein